MRLFYEFHAKLLITDVSRNGYCCSALLLNESDHLLSVDRHPRAQTLFNFYQGPLTVGIIPPSTQRARIDALKPAADVASQCGIPSVHTHCGFIPEDPNDPLYPQAVAAVKEVAVYCKQRGRRFLCETGEETPITLLRLIQDVGLDNVYVNLDLANLIL